MVMRTQFLSASLRAIVLGGVAFLAACQTVEPKTTESTLVATPSLTALRPGDIGVLPVEDGTQDSAFARHLTYARQELQRQLVERLYNPISARELDVALASTTGVVEASAGRDSILVPAKLRTLVGHAKEDALVAVRIDRWDETRLLIDRRVRFSLQAAMVAKNGEQLWSGTLRGEVKAGGYGAAPRDRDNMARSCISLVVGELYAQLPQRKI